MLRICLQTDKGPIGIVGINDENLRRMKAGMPLDVNIKDITPPGTRMNRVIIHYAHTYAQVVDDMEKGGLPINEDLKREAQDLDEQLKRERRDK